MWIRPKKHLGQDFLVDANIQRKIIEACELGTSDIVLEIGSGRGELTGFLADNSKKVYAVELDGFLCKILKDKFSSYDNIEILNLDILDLNLKKYFGKTGQRIKVVGNIPYYITTPIIAHLLKAREVIDSIFLTVQKEFARRITAKVGSKDYGAFSCFIQYYTEPKVIFSIKKSSFWPRPRVDSCFIKLSVRHKSIFEIENEEFLFRIIRLAFNQRRKTLRNSLSTIVKKETLETFFSEFNIPANIRPEQLSLKYFVNLIKTFKKV
jgi:16S rRNA (adenine1518-N6/adenine1519-N6)-dimethyltransferase